MQNSQKALKCCKWLSTTIFVAGFTVKPHQKPQIVSLSLCSKIGKNADSCRFLSSLMLFLGQLLDFGDMLKPRKNGMENTIRAKPQNRSNWEHCAFLNWPNVVECLENCKSGPSQTARKHNTTHTTHTHNTQHFKIRAKRFWLLRSGVRTPVMIHMVAKPTKNVCRLVC